MSVPPDLAASVSRRFRRLQRAEREFLPAALEVLETPESPVARTLFSAILALILACVLFATLGEIDVTLEAEGAFRMPGLATLRAPAGAGQLSALHVENGQLVGAGEPLLVIRQEQQAEGPAEALLRAPVAGTVVGLAHRDPGEPVAPGETLLSLLPPSGAIAIELYVPLEDIGAVVPGQEADVRIGRQPLSLPSGEPWRVSRLGRQAIARKPRSGAPSALVVPVWLEPDHPHPVEGLVGLLFPGAVVSAEIHVGRRPILDLLLAPRAGASSPR